MKIREDDAAAAAAVLVEEMKKTLVKARHALAQLDANINAPPTDAAKAKTQTPPASNKPKRKRPR
jgi:uncharacterized protein (UPF0261 family)